MFAHRHLSLYGGHHDELNCLTFSLDFKILLTGSVDGCIRSWNTVRDHLIYKIQEQKGLIRALAISNNNKYFASTAHDIDVRLYKTKTGHLIRVLSGHTYPSDCLHFSSDNQLLASGAWDHRTILWNVTTGEQTYDLYHHTNAVQSIAFHPDKNIMATGSYDRHIFLYDFDELVLSAPVKLVGHHNNVRALTFSRLSYLASAGWDKTIIIWHIETKRIHSRLTGHTGWIQAVTFHDNNAFVLASADDDTVRVWNIITGRCLHRLQILNDLLCFIRFLPSDQGIRIGGVVYEVLFDQDKSCRKRVHEPPTKVDKLLSSSKTTNIKLPNLQSKRI